MFTMNPVFGITVVAVGVLIVSVLVKKFLAENKKEELTPRERCNNCFPGLLKAMEMVAQYAVDTSDVFTQVHITAMPDEGRYRLQMITAFSLKDGGEESRERLENYFKPTWSVIEDEGRLYFSKEIYPQYTNVEIGSEDRLTLYLGEVHPEWEYDGSKITFRNISIK